jgi:hypothetical protein
VDPQVGVAENELVEPERLPSPTRTAASTWSLPRTGSCSQRTPPRSPASWAACARAGARLGISYWLPNPELAGLLERFGYRRPEAADSPRDWGRPEYVRELLGSDFELEFSGDVCPWTGASGEQIWQLTVSPDGAAKSGLAAMSPAERDELHRDWVAYFERYRSAAGSALRAHICSSSVGAALSR